MMSNNRKDYGSASEWLAALRQDDAWLSQLQKLQSSPESDISKHHEEAVRRIGNGETCEFWEIYQHKVESVVAEVWEIAELTLIKLKIQTIGMLSIEWLERLKETAEALCQSDDKEQLYFFAPKKNLQELLKGKWFAKVRSNPEFDVAWTDGFIEALIASEYGKEITRQWMVDGVRNKRNLLKGYVVGLLKDAGVLKGSYNNIAKKMGTKEYRTFSKYMGDGKKQPYADWVKDYVSGKKNQ